MYREPLQLTLKMQYQPKYICKICGCVNGVGLYLNTFRILGNTSRRISKVAKIAFQLRHVRPPVRLSDCLPAYINSCATGRILIKCCTGGGGYLTLFLKYIFD